MERRSVHPRREAIQRRLVHFALKHRGKPYEYGAPQRAVPKRFDCSSFVQYLYRRVGIKLPRTAIEQALCGRTVKIRSVTDLETGDLLFFTGRWGRYDPAFPEGIGHVALYLGDGKIIHAKYVENGRHGGSVQRASAARWLARADLVVVKRIIL